MVEMAIFNIQRAIPLKVGKQELRFMCSACRLMVFNVCVKFHENMSSGFKVMERTQKLLTDTHTKKEHYIPHCMHTLYAGGITRFIVHVFCISSHGVKVWVKFHENMSSSFKVMERTRKLLTHKGQ